MTEKPNRTIGELLDGMGQLLQDVDDEPSDDLSAFHDGLNEIRATVTEESDPHLLFLEFFLQRFTKDLWDNVAMTSSLHIEDEYIIRVLESLGPYFVRLGENVRNSNYEECYSEYVGLYSTYIDRVKEENARSLIQ